MPEKLLTLKELSDYLHISEEDIIALVDRKVISAYRIGGELLRLRKEQIEAIRSEIEARVKEGGRTNISDARKKMKERHKAMGQAKVNNSFIDAVADFFYFNDFYIVSTVLIVLLLFFIFVM